MLKIKIVSLRKLEIIAGSVFTVLLINSNVVCTENRNCKESETTINGGEQVCVNTVIFEDDFDTYNTNKWKKEHFIPNYYGQDPSMDLQLNLFKKENVVYNGKQVIFIPEVLGKNEQIRSYNFTSECTSLNAAECSAKNERKFIVPQIATGRITTKNTFSFKYGTIDIIAQVPSGDWLLPEMRLEPKKNSYGAGLESGRILLALVRGNKEVIYNDTNIGEDTLESGLLVMNNKTPDPIIKAALLRVEAHVPWHENFNKYSFHWRPDGCSFSVNDFEIGTIKGNLLKTLFNKESNEATNEWNNETTLAPFDKEFYISLGLSVGGRDFPEACKSNGIKMHAFLNTSLMFWNEKEKWEKTWKSPKDRFIVTKIKITSL